jgi:hypothetical protein
MLRTAIFSVAAFAIVAGSGLVHGFWTDRWGRSPTLEEAIASLDRMPRSVGDWHGQDVEMSTRDMQRTGASGWLARRYRHRGTQASVSVFLVCGRGGPVSVHTPDVCYGGAGYETMGRPTEHAVELAGGQTAVFRTTRFRKVDSPSQEHLRIFWTWRVPGGDWTAPQSPRLTFARAPALEKLYVIRQMVSPDDELETDPALDLISQLLPALEPAKSADS